MQCPRLVTYRQLVSSPNNVIVGTYAKLYRTTFPHQAERLRGAPEHVIERAVGRCGQPAHCTCVGAWTVYGENLEAPEPGPPLVTVRGSSYLGALRLGLSLPGFFLEGNGGLVLPAPPASK